MFFIILIIFFIIIFLISKFYKAMDKPVNVVILFIIFTIIGIFKAIEKGKTEDILGVIILVSIGVGFVLFYKNKFKKKELEKDKMIERLLYKAKNSKNDGTHYLNLAKLYSEENGNEDKVEEFLMKSIEEDNNPEANFLYAELLVKRGRIIDSIEYMYQAGLGYIKNNEKEKTLLIIRGIEEIDNNCKRINQLRDELYPDY